LNLAVSSYSFNRFGQGPEGTDRPTFEAMIERKVRRLLEDACFRGYVSLEFEGKALPDQGVPESIAMLRKTLGI
jgi:hypothetical protein